MENQKEGKKKFLSERILELEGRKIWGTGFVLLEESKKINTDTGLASSLPWQISWRFHSCSCFVFSRVGVWGGTWQKLCHRIILVQRDSKDLTQFFLLRVRRALNSNLLFYPVSSGKNPGADSWVEEWGDWITPRAEGSSPALLWQVLPWGTAQEASPGPWKSLFLWLNRHCFSYNQLPA